MTENEAYAILHPDTTAKKIAEIEYYAGLRGKEAAIKAVEDACIVACESMVQLALYEAIGTVEEFKDLKEKNEPKKPIELGRWGEYYKCPVCGKYAVDNLGCKYKFCRECGTEFDWSE